MEIVGAYATASERVRGMGGTAQEARERLLWFVVRSKDSCEVFALNGRRQVTAVRKSIAAADFARDFEADPELWASDILPVLRSLLSRLEQSKGVPDMAGLTDPEKGMLMALRTATAGVPGDRTAVLMDVLRAGVGNGEAILERQCGESNALAIRLRKENDPAAALEHYAKVRSVSPLDEHLLFNMARAHYQRGEAELCRELLGKSLALRPDFREARAFLRWLDLRTPARPRV